MLNNRQNTTAQFILNSALVIMCVVFIIPFLMLLGVSFSNEKDIAYTGYKLFPQHFDLSAYKYVFTNPNAIISGYRVTIIISAVTMVMSVLFQAMLAYPLTRKAMPGRKGLSFYIYFTMLFSGGLVPSYILITKYYHLGDTLWVYILPALISPWYVFMMRTFFSGIPNEIAESVYIDGGSDYIVFFKMILPLSKPVLAAVALFMFLGKWNDWFTALIYINKDELISLQYLLQRIMQNIQLLQNSSQTGNPNLISAAEIPSETVRMAMAVVVAGPALVVFPFFQKYFVKGMTVGSVKG